MNASGSAPHRVERFVASREYISQLRAIDYRDAPLSSVPYDAIATSGEAPSHKWELKADVLERGILIPILVTSRRGEEPSRLVDGHHRSRLGLDLGLAVEAELHDCFCPASTLDSFGLCPQLWARTRELQAEAL